MSESLEQVVERIAAAAHEAQRAHAVELGEAPGPTWAESTDEGKATYRAGVLAILKADVTSVEQSHEQWRADKARAGWRYGATKDASAKTHPNLVPWLALAPAQQSKDRVFFETVHATRPKPAHAS